jgi:hypothetical protein
MPIVIPTTPRLVKTLTLGSNLTAGQETKIELSSVQPFVDVGRKSMLKRLRFKVTAAFTITAAQPALASVWLKFFLDKRLVGPANYPIVDKQPGWQDVIWAYLQKGEIDWLRCRDIAAGTTSATRTWEQAIEFEEPAIIGQGARFWPVEAFKAPGSGLYLTLRGPTLTLKGVATITITSCTIQVYADVFDVPANAVSIPTLVTRYSLATMAADATPTPGIGRYLRIVMANSPLATDNVDTTFGAAGGTADDLSAYTTVESFGYQGAFSVYQEAVDQLIQRKMREISVEQHSQLDNNAGNKSEFRFLDPQENFDGLLHAIPLVTPTRGTQDMQRLPQFADVPRLQANGGSRAGLPAGFNWLCERVDIRTAAVLNATVGALTDVNGRSALGKNTATARGYTDPSVAPLTIDLR